MVTRIDPYSQLATGRKLRTCAYCRVSSNSADQLHSYAAQVKYYTKAIKERSDWEFVDVFADEGITGTRADKRPEFQRMIKLCNMKRIDLIVTKSISRFARNVPECLEYARSLKRIGVGIIFEENGINTLRMGDELMMTTFSAIAQEESMAISQRLKHKTSFNQQIIDRKLSERYNRTRKKKTRKEHCKWKSIFPLKSSLRRSRES